mmetsp:Transcript_1036/g.3379  ORF Transcript_1036/g.3379 Transcript_1036/m.3379 type:complete len:683 (-) Transcript_1036:1041-3089(-)
MGFITPLFVWEETDAEVTVRVEVKNVPRATIDVFASSCYLKVNAPPFLFSCDLHGEIVEQTCVATVDAFGVHFRCPKAEPGITWGRLRREVAGGNLANAVEERDLLTERRRASVEQAHARVVAEKRAELKKKERTDKAYLEKQWELERTKRVTIERRKDAEMAEERARLRLWQEDGDKRAASGGNNSDEDVEYDSDDDVTARAAKEKGTRKAREREFADAILTPDAVQAAEGLGSVLVEPKPVDCEMNDKALEAMLVRDDADETESDRVTVERKTLELKQKQKAKASEEARAAKAAHLNRPFPAKRQTIQPVTIEFTKLETDHMPARASREREIREWRRKNTPKTGASRKEHEPADITTREPIYLKDKADSFFRVGDFKSATRAYTNAVDVERTAPHPDGVLVKILANRAACFCALGEFDSGEQDCSDALDLLEKEEGDEDGARWSPGEIKKQRFKLLVRRAMCFGQMGDAAGAACDLREAVRLAPDDSAKQTLLKDLREAERCVAPMTAQETRVIGDERYRNGDTHGALAAYHAALAMPFSFSSEEDEHEVSDEVCYVTRRATERSLAHANRAAVFLSLSDHGAAHDDCEEGLDVLLRAVGGDSASARTAAVSVNLRGDAKTACEKLLHRRAAASAHLRRYQSAALDYEVLVELATDDETKQARSDDARTVRALADEDGGE